MGKGKLIKKAGEAIAKTARGSSNVRNTGAVRLAESSKEAASKAGLKTYQVTIDINSKALRDDPKTAMERIKRSLVRKLGKTGPQTPPTAKLIGMDEWQITFKSTRNPSAVQKAVESLEPGQGIRVFGFRTRQGRDLPIAAKSGKNPGPHKGDATPRSKGGAPEGKAAARSSTSKVQTVRDENDGGFYPSKPRRSPFGTRERMEIDRMKKQ